MAQQFNKVSGTQLAVIGTEHTLNTDNTPGVFVITVNLRNMLNADFLELRAYTKTLTGDSQAYLLYRADYANLQGNGAAPGSSANAPVQVASIAIVSAHQCIVTLKQTAGVGRNFDWRVDQIS